VTSQTHFPTLEEVSDSIDGLRLGLRADGYDLEVTGIDDKLRMRVIALEDACEDCLVPREAMARILAAKLQDRQDSITSNDIDLTYPADH